MKGGIDHVVVITITEAGIHNGVIDTTIDTNAGSGTCVGGNRI